MHEDAEGWSLMPELPPVRIGQRKVYGAEECLLMGVGQ